MLTSYALHSQSPILFLLGYVLYELCEEDIMGENECVKLLLEAGAGTSLLMSNNESLKHSYEGDFLQKAVVSVSMVCLLLPLFEQKILI